MIKDKNYIQIQGWMVTELKLAGNELLVYALIYGFCQDGQSLFQGSSTYISEWLNISKNATLSILKRLCEKRLILKIEKNINGVKLCDYTTLPLDKKLNHPDQETSLGVGQETLPHNNILNNTIIKEEKYKKEFNQFWDIYPKTRAGSKDKAYKSYIKAIDSGRCTIEKMYNSAYKYAQSREVSQGYAKGCAAWINDDRFNNEYVEYLEEQY